ncbi:hypothetical protein RirG_260340 [Rhizophagus irregularis DAOM 197198w]|uniref:Uncharacterized protein n=1 Tax=Rhizophagus irregularis (strain DAOM 197198w) TaxID=1432141 RepID=A0A015L9Y7_RHIIW|nr:hypothetical protein RirG_260340 [Rhizophagus irregularis DAOM 197198w]
MNKINLYEEQIFKDDKWLPSWPSSNGEHIEEDVNCPSVKFKVVSERKKNILRMRQTGNNFKLKIIKYGILISLIPSQILMT